jgi:acyl-CoA synthetase (NDP forming)
MLSPRSKPLLAAIINPGYPAALKIVSTEITHKMDDCGVVLSLAHAESVRVTDRRIMQAERPAARRAD